MKACNAPLVVPTLSKVGGSCREERELASGLPAPSPLPRKRLRKIEAARRRT